MRPKRNSLFSEIEGLEAPRRACLPKPNYDAIIARQQLLLLQLQNENKLLRQYALYFVGEPDEDKEVETDSSLLTGESGKECLDDSDSKTRRKGSSLKELVK